MLVGLYLLVTHRQLRMFAITMVVLGSLETGFLLSYFRSTPPAESNTVVSFDRDPEAARGSQNGTRTSWSGSKICAYVAQITSARPVRCFSAVTTALASSTAHRHEGGLVSGLARMPALAAEASNGSERNVGRPWVVRSFGKLRRPRQRDRAELGIWRKWPPLRYTA